MRVGLKTTLFPSLTILQPLPMKATTTEHNNNQYEQRHTKLAPHKPSPHVLYFLLNKNNYPPLELMMLMRNNREQPQ